MTETSLTLLELMKRDDDLAWKEFERVYKPILSTYLSHVLRAFEVDEVFVDVLSQLRSLISNFEHRGPGSFRGYLRQICYRKVKEFQARQRRGRGLTRALAETSRHPVEEIVDPKSPLNEKFEDQHQQYVQELALQEARRRCGDWAVELYLASLHRVAGRTDVEVAGEWGIKVDKFYYVIGKVNKAFESFRKTYRHLFDF